MVQIILLCLMMAGTVHAIEAADNCSECHGNRQKMAAIGFEGFAVTQRETEAQTRMPARCSDCHLGHPEESDRTRAHKGMARLLDVAKKNLAPMTSARRYPLNYGTNPLNRLYTVTEKDGTQIRDASVAAISWHDKNPETLSQDFGVMKKTCGSCHEQEFAEFTRSTMARNGKQSQYAGWITPNRGPHNCGPWFDGNLEVLQANTRLTISPESNRVNQRACNTCHVGCLDCHFNPQRKDPADPSRGPHTFAKTPPPESCYGNGRASICHAGPEDRRRGAGYFGGPFSFPEGSEADCHVRARVGCLDCHESSKSNPAMGHAMIRRQARDSCKRCHPEAVKSHGTSRHKNLSCEACHIQRVGGYQGTYWGPGMIAGMPTPFFKFKAYYGIMTEPVLLRDQRGIWIPVKPYPMAVMNQKTSPYTSGLKWRYPKELPDLERTDDAWGYVGLIGGLPENNSALIWIQMDKLSHKIGKSRSCDSCHANPDGSQLQKVTWEYEDPGALPFSGGHEVLANHDGLFIRGMYSERITPEPGYSLSAFAPWIYLKERWRIPGDFALPAIGDRQQYETFRADAPRSRRAGIIHGLP